eukprot:scaffold125856_cov18-Tisochrysis_lutea.AAC.1
MQGATAGAPSAAVAQLRPPTAPATREAGPAGRPAAHAQAACVRACILCLRRCVCDECKERKLHDVISHNQQVSCV